MILKKKKSGFTLIELLVSIAVFLILLVMMLQFLAGTQQIWKGTSGRGDVYVESKTAMDLMASLFREVNYVQFYENPGDTNTVNYPFYIPKDANGRLPEIHFFGRSDADFGTTSLNDVYLFSIGLSGNKLQIRGIPAYASGEKSKNYDAAIAGTWSSVLAETEAPFTNAAFETIIDRVTGLDFYPLYRNADGSLDSGGDPKNRIPAALMIQLRMLDKNNFEIYSETNNDKFLRDNELSFSRIIYFDNRDYVVE